MNTYSDRQSMRNDPLAQRKLRLLGTVGLLSTAAAATTIVVPVLYQLQIALCTILPICSLLVIRSSKGSITLANRFKGLLPSLAPLVLCLFALVHRAYYDSEILSYTSFLLPFGICAVFFFLFIVWSDTSPEMGQLGKDNKLEIISFTIASLLFAYGFVGSANVAFDRSAPTRFRAKVIDNRYTTTYNQSDDDFGSSDIEHDYYLTLDAWGPQDKIEEVSVSQGLYYSVSVGDYVTVQLYKGAFWIPNYRLE